MAKEKKEVKKEVKKVEKKESKKAVKKESIISTVVNFVKGVKTEWKRIKWPTRKDMVKYSIATIIFIVGCSLFFFLIDIVLAFFHTLGN